MADSDKRAGPLRRLIESAGFNRVVVAVILANAVTLGLETMPAINAEHGATLKAIDRGFLAFFCAELALKLVSYRLAFFRSGWNWFDAIIVAASLVPGAGPWSVLRAFRLFRLFSAVRSMRTVVEGLFQALPGMSAIVAVLSVVFYASAVAATKLFSPHPSLTDLFGSLPQSAYTLFRVMTLDGWTEITDRTLAVAPWAMLFFLPFIVLTSFAVLNLFIAVIVEALNNQREGGAEGGRDAALAHLTAAVTRLEAEVRALRERPHEPEPARWHDDREAFTNEGQRRSGE